MTQTAKRILQEKATDQLKKRVSAKIQQRVENTPVATVSAKVSHTTSVIAEKTDKQVQRVKTLKKWFARVLAVVSAVLWVFHKLNRLYSLIPKAKGLNDKISALTGVDIAAKVMPSKSKE